MFIKCNFNQSEYDNYYNISSYEIDYTSFKYHTVEKNELAMIINYIAWILGLIVLVVLQWSIIYYTFKKIIFPLLICLFQ